MIDEIDDVGSSTSTVAPVDNGFDRLDELSAEQRELIQRTSEVYASHLSELQNISDLSEGRKPFPHFAWETLKLGLGKENEISERLHHHIDQIQEMQQTIELLLKLNSILPKEDNAEIPPEANQILDQLEERGVTLRNAEDVTVEQMKQRAASHESQLRSKIHIELETKVKWFMDLLQTILNILQEVIKKDARIKERANQLQK